MALHKGQPVSGAYVVLAGRLRVFSLSPNGTEATLYFIDPGETCVLALNCLFNDLLYPAWVQAETASSIALIPGAVYRKLFERETAIQNLTVHTLSTLVFRLMSELELVHSSHHKQRLANFILMRLRRCSAHDPAATRPASGHHARSHGQSDAGVRRTQSGQHPARRNTRSICSPCAGSWPPRLLLSCCLIRFVPFATDPASSPHYRAARPRALHGRNWQDWRCEMNAQWFNAISLSRRWP